LAVATPHLTLNQRGRFTIMMMGIILILVLLNAIGRWI
jgi:hypothetical protein